MKNLLLGIAFVIITQKTQAQIIRLNFNDTQAGKNVSAVYAKSINKHEWGFGLRYNTKQPDHFYDPTVYTNKLYPKTFFQHWGLHLHYHYSVFPNWQEVSPFLFADIQTSYATVISKSDNFPTHFRGPYHWMENCIGFGFESKINDQWSISAKTGMGAMLITPNIPPIRSKYHEGLTWDPYYLLNFGIGYRLKTT